MYDDFNESIDEEIEALPDHKKILAFKRACLRLGIPFEEQSEGTLSVDKEWEVFESDEFAEEFGEQLKLIYIQGLLTGLEEDGLIAPVGVDPETGQYNYELTDAGRDHVDNNLL